MAVFLIRAKIDPSGAGAGAKVVKGHLIGLQRQANVLRGAFLRAFGVIGLATGIKSSIDLIADFSLAITTAGAISTRELGRMEGNIAALEKEARHLGATTKFTATEAAEGMLFLARAGFTVSENLQTAGKALKLAQAGNIDLGRAADIVTNIMAGFSEDVDQASRFIDVVAKTANSANTNIQQLGDALKFAGPIAAATGVEVEEASAAIAALSDAGLQGTLAGTGFRRVLSELEAPSIKATKFLRSLGLSQSDVRVSTNGLVPVIQKLVTAGFDVGDALEFFGDRGGPAFQVISNAVKEGYLEQMTGQLKRAKGTTDTIADAMDNTLKGALHAVRSAWEAFTLSIKDVGGETALTKFVRKIVAMIRFLAKHMQVVSKIAKTLAYILGVILAARAIMFLIRMIGKLWVVMAANPVAALIIAITAAAYALYQFSDQIKVTKDGSVTLRDVFSAIFSYIGKGLSVLAKFWQDIWSIMQGDAGDAMSWVQQDIAKGLNFIIKVVDFLIGGINGVITAFIFTFDKIPGAAADAIATAVNFWIEKFEALVNWTLRGVNKLKTALGGEEIAPIEFGRVAGEGLELEDLIKQMQLIIKDGIESTPVEDAMNNLLKEAERIAKNRPKKTIPEPESALPKLNVDLTAVNKSFKVYLYNLEEEAMKLRMSEDARESYTRMIEAEEQLGRSLLKTDKDQIQTRLDLIYLSKVQGEVMQDILGPYIELAKQEKAITNLRKDGTITLRQYRDAMDEVRYQSLQLRKDIDAGEGRALISVKQDIMDLASLTENTLVGAFNSVETAITELVSTGEADFHRLAQTIFAETSRILIRLMLLKAFGLFSSGTDPISTVTSGPQMGMGGSPVIPTFQHGGSFKVGGSGGPDSQYVAFRASPGERVDVTPPGHSPGSEVKAGDVNVKVVNVDDPKTMLSVLSSSLGERVILNTITKNPTVVKRSLGGAG